MYISHELVSGLLEKRGVEGTLLCVKVIRIDSDVHIRVQVLDGRDVRTIDSHIPIERFKEILEADNAV